jgi:FkbM family methyltransferase
MRLLATIRIISRTLGQIPGVFSLVVNPVLRRLDWGDSAGQVCLIGGARFELDLNDYTQRRAWCGVFERKEVDFIHRLLQAGHVAIDVGANVGLLTIPMAIAVGDSGRVVAVDPIPANINQLSRNLQLNQLSNTVLVQCAAGSHEGSIRLTNHHTSADKSTGFYHRIHDDSGGISVEQIRLEAKLNTLLDTDTSVKLLKIDVEGMESDVLEGLGSWLNPQRIENVLFEVFVSRDGVDGNAQSTIATLVGAGYEIRFIGGNGQLGLKSVSGDDLTRRRPTALNLVAIGAT